MNGQRYLVFFLPILIVCGSFSGCLDNEVVVKGDPMPEWSSVADDNMTYSKSNMIGTKHLIHFSASWCTPCRDVMHMVTGELPDVEYLIISTDSGDEGWEELNDWHQQVNGANDSHDVDAPFMANSELAEEVDIRNTPTIFLVDSDGYILARHIGAFDNNQEIQDLWNTE
ncbi:MAG: hypothetical protein CMA11_02460, partial [Euryarchaeota archaeon]|nr:hypothetical protein [Euryarchaeota archaeon]